MRTPSGTCFSKDQSVELISHRKWLALVLTVATALLVVAVSKTPFSTRAHAQEAITPQAGRTFTVNTTADPGGPFVNCTTRGGECTLREAITEANATAGDDTINFAFQVNPTCVGGGCLIILQAPLPDLSTNIAIIGLGPDKVIVLRPSAGGLADFRIFNVTTNGTVSFSGLAIANGTAPANGAGGGIRNAGGGIVAITNCSLQFNSASQGGAVANENHGRIDIIESKLVNNTSFGGGGGIVNGAILGGTLNILNSTISDNKAGAGGGILNSGTLSVTGSTLNHNQAVGGNGGAIASAGTLVLSISTISNNSADYGGGIFNGLGDTHATAFVINSTISSNSAAQHGGGIFNFVGAAVSIKNSLIALNTGPDPDGSGPFNSAGNNLIGKKDGSTGFTHPSDQSGTIAAPLDPKLDPSGLKDNGGPTPTIALFCGSPAIDRASSVGLNGDVITDQRGAGFPRTFDDFAVPNLSGSDGTDVGAFERQQTCGPIVQFSSANYSVVEDCTTVTITVNRTGDTSGACSVDYATANGTATERRDYITALGRLQFAAGETSKSFAVLVNEDSNVEGNETFSVNLSNPSAAGIGTPATAIVEITDDASEPATNVIDDPQTYVCQHYHDFLNRQPDASGFAFWTSQITSCGSDAGCLELRRINVSASFFLSIEFQDTGYLVERIYKAAFGDAISTSTFPSAHQIAVPVVRLNEFLADTQEIGKGVIVGQGNWEQQLENNKEAFTAAFLQRPRLGTASLGSLTAEQFVDRLNTNAGNPLSPTERNQLVNDLSTNAKTRAQILRAVAEDVDLRNAEFNRAFVLMQYFGYLRRNPNDPQDSDYTGYDFWLTKLNQFGGNYINAEMVKAILTSIEYRQRFGP